MSQSATPVKILGLGGSLRVPSHSLTVLKLALTGATEAGAVVDLLDLNELTLPFFRPEQPLESYLEADYIRQYLARFQAADGFLWCAPTYHATPSAAFKNALDFLELLPRRPHLYLTGKVAGLISLAGGANAGGESLTALYYNARALKLLVAPGSFHVSPAKRLFDDQGHLQDDRTLSRLHDLGTEVVRLAERLK